MEKSTSSTSKAKVEKTKKEESVKSGKKKRTPGQCSSSDSSSHTNYFRIPRHEDEHKRITRDQYYNISESISTSDTFRCVHGSEGKVYTREGLLKRNFLKELDPVPIDFTWTDECPVPLGWQVADKIAFLFQDSGLKQFDRLQVHLRDFIKISSKGYRVDILDSCADIIHFVLDSMHSDPYLKEIFVLLLENMTKPILLTGTYDVVKHSNTIAQFLQFMMYLLMSVEDDSHFELLSQAILWHLSAPDSVRPPNAAPLRYTIATASSLVEPTVKMLAVARPKRFLTFLKISLLLACHSQANCLDMMEDNIIENIFYRFNPFFPDQDLPLYDIHPADCQDMYLKLGDSSVHLPTTLSLLLVLLKTTKEYLEHYPNFSSRLPCPDYYSQRCFIWAYRYECRARDHRHQRTTFTVIIAVLLKIFGRQLSAFSSLLMPDILSLAVLTEISPNDSWVASVNMNSMQEDAQFKKILIYLAVDMFKVFPSNKFMLRSRYWLLGLTYLLDPGLSPLRASWSQSLFSELRKTTLQALVCVLPICEPELVKEYAVIRRIMWYIEWYTESPYEISTLYWCVRLLQVTVYNKQSAARSTSIQDIFDSHGIIVLIHLCHTLLNQKLPPVEKCQAVLGLCLRLITTSVKTQSHSYVTCCVYPYIRWPMSINPLAQKMLSVVMYSLEKHFFISDRWLISLLNFIWEAIIWRKDYREKFVGNDGVYTLLDIITLSPPPVQCIALALICDIARAGCGVGHLVTWRAKLQASHVNPVLVKHGSSIAALIAAIFYDECQQAGVSLSEQGVLLDMECPIMTAITTEALYSQDLRYYKSYRTPVCLTAAEIAGSRMSKVFAILHLLSEDLIHKVDISDEAYNLYKNIKLNVKDETILVLCSHYLTLKLCEAWVENKVQNVGLVQQDAIILGEFLNIGNGWAKEIKIQQEEVIARHEKKEEEEEHSLYAFLGRIRLNIALDALRGVRCCARSADRSRITHALLNDAVFVHHRRSIFAKEINAPVLRTFKPPLDEANITGQNVRVFSINPFQRANIGFVNSSSSLHESECHFV